MFAQVGRSLRQAAGVALQRVIVAIQFATERTLEHPAQDLMCSRATIVCCVTLRDFA